MPKFFWGGGTPSPDPIPVDAFGASIRVPSALDPHPQTTFLDTGLTDRRKDARLTLFSKAVSGHSAISVCHLSRPTRFSRNVYESSFIPISARTDVYKNYTLSSLARFNNDCNSLPATIRLMSPTSHRQVTCTVLLNQ